MLHFVALLTILAAADPPDDRPPIPVVKLDRAAPVSFEKEITPILEAKCQTCHSGTDPRSGYDMSGYESFIKGGKRGAAVVAGKSADSLITHLAGRTKAPHMPPKKNDPLTPEELALLKLWIDQGARGKNIVRERPAVKLSELPARVQPVRALAINADKTLLAIGRGNQVDIHDLTKGDRLRSLRPAGQKSPHSAVVESLTFSPDRRTLASASFREVVLWDPGTGEVKRRLTDFVDRVMALAFSADGRLIATAGGMASQDGEVKVFETETGKLVLDVKACHSDTVFGIAFSPDGRMLATAGADKFVKTWEVPSGKPLKSFEGHTHHVLDVAWNGTGTKLVSAGADGVLKVWDFDRGEAARTLSGHTQPVTRLTVIGAGPLVLSCSGDRTARLWNIDTGASPRTFNTSEYLHAAAATADGRIIALGGEDGTVRVMQGNDGKLLRMLKAESVHP